MIDFLILAYLLHFAIAYDYNSGIFFLRDDGDANMPPFNAACRVQIYHEEYGTMDVCIGMNVHPDKAIVNKNCLDAFPGLNFTEHLGLAHLSAPVSWNEMSNLLKSPYIHRVLDVKHVAIGNGGHASILFHTGRDENLIPISKSYPAIFDIVWAIGYGHPNEKVGQVHREQVLRVEKTYKRPVELCETKDLGSELCFNRDNEFGFFSVSNAGGPFIYDGKFIGFAKFSGLRWRYDKMYIGIHDFRPAYQEVQEILNHYRVNAPRYYGNLKFA